MHIESISTQLTRLSTTRPSPRLVKSSWLRQVKAPGSNVDAILANTNQLWAWEQELRIMPEASKTKPYGGRKGVVLAVDECEEDS